LFLIINFIIINFVIISSTSGYDMSGTRSKHASPFGSLPLKWSQLPTFEDVGKHFNFIREALDLEKPKPTLRFIGKLVCARSNVQVMQYSINPLRNFFRWNFSVFKESCCNQRSNKKLIFALYLHHSVYAFIHSFIQFFAASSPHHVPIPLRLTIAQTRMKHESK
jgi:hypothetical protein